MQAYYKEREKPTSNDKNKKNNKRKNDGNLCLPIKLVTRVI
jgi:hypothetical protein